MNDLTNREQATYDYIKEVMRTNFPKADLRDDGEFMETFGLPHIKLLVPLISFADRIKLMQSIENAEELTVEEMDRMGSKEYVYRHVGRRSTGYVTFVFSEIPPSGNVNIPAFLEAESKSGLLYVSVENINMGLESLVEYYDPATFKYRIPVLFEAEREGKAYDAKEGEVIQLNHELMYLDSVINETPFTGGIDVETNIEMAERIREHAMAPNLGVKRGYKRFFESFTPVKEVLVAGYGHPLMRRDIIGEFEIPGMFVPKMKEIHWGTKVDAYIRGENLLEHTEYLEVQENEAGEAYVSLNSKPVRDVINVTLYSPSGEFDDPNIDPASLFVNNFILRKEESFEDEGTIDEVVSVFLRDARTLPGTFVRVRYRYNALIKEIHDTLYEDDNRPPTADVKTKEAPRKYVTGSVIAKMVSPIGMRERDRNLLRQRLSQWIDTIPLGQEFQFSDIHSPLSETNEGDTEDGLVDYIHLPFQFLTLKNNDQYIFYCGSKEQREVTDAFAAEKAYLYSVFEKYKNKVKVYDFFDLLHALTYNNGFMEAAETLGFESYEFGKVVEAFNNIRNMVLRASVISKMSPATATLDQHEFFEMGELFVYEAKTYSSDDWKKLILLYRNIAAAGDETTDGIKEMYELGLFLVSTVMIFTETYVTEAERVRMYRFIAEIIRSTPIEHNFVM